MIPLPAAADKKYVVLGLGKSGLAAARALMESGARIIAWDDSEAARHAALGQKIPLADSPDIISWRGVTALVIAPGIPHTYPAPHPVAAAAKAANIPLTGDIALLFQAQPKAKYVGITGANGKSTTTALIGHIAQQAGLRAETGGNLGIPALALPPLGKDGVYILELSSYQLELIDENRLDVGVLLNITPDHLDRHGGMAGYEAAKARIVRRDAAQIFICGMDDAPSRAIAAQAAALPRVKLQTISIAGQIDCTFHADDAHLIDNSEGKSERVIAWSDLPRLPGRHNRQNVAAAWAVSLALGIDRAAIIAGMKSFPGLAHRQQLVAMRGGVRYVNDSKATNAEAAGKALACYDDIYWIVGGLPKEGGLDGLESFMPRIRHAFLIGQAGGDFASWLDGKASYTRCETLEAAVRAAVSMANEEKPPGATVLLSPACASFDQFKSFEHRGESFTALVLQSLPPAADAQGAAQ